MGYFLVLTVGYLLGLLTYSFWFEDSKKYHSTKKVEATSAAGLASKKDTNGKTQQLNKTESEAPKPEVSNNFFDFSQVISDFFIPREKKITLLSNLTAFTEEDLAKIGNIDEFANKLWSLAANEQQANELIENPDAYGKLIFSTDLVDHNSGGRTIFSSEDYKIFTVYTLNAVNDNRVLVKWMNQSNGELKLFKQITINPQLEQNYLWVNELKGWKPGTYIVEFYTMDESLELLAGGTYYVQ